MHHTLRIKDTLGEDENLNSKFTATAVPGESKAVLDLFLHKAWHQLAYQSLKTSHENIICA